MRLKNLVLLFLLIVAFPSFSNIYSHNPNKRSTNNHYSRSLVLVSRPFIVAPQPFGIVTPPPPRYVKVVINNPHSRRMDTNDVIRNAKNAISDQRFEADKLRIAKEVSIDLPLKSIDVLDIIQMFTFESSRLEYAKFAYSKTLDIENYSIVFEAFKYTSSVKNLEDYIYSGK